MELPRVESRELEIFCEVTRWDGPTSGLCRRGTELCWFDSLADDDDGPGTFNLHAIAPEAVAAAEAWCARFVILGEELRLAANPHIWPLTKRQRATLRALRDITADCEEHARGRPRWEASPPVAWFSGAGDGRFYAIQTVTRSADRGQALTRWQRDVAQALATEDQPALDRLFADPPVPCEPLEIFFVHRRPGDDDADACVLRDWRGQPLPVDFEMTARHQVHCFDHLVPGTP